MAASDSITHLLAALRGVLAGISDPEQVLRLILDGAVERTGADRGVFVEVRREGELDFRVLHAMTRESLDGPSGEFSRSVLRDVLERRCGVRLENAATTARYSDAESVQMMRLVSVLCLPLVIDDEVAAMVHLECGRPGQFTVEHERLVNGLLEGVSPAYDLLRAGRGVLAERDELRETNLRTEAQLAEERKAAEHDWSFARFVGRAPAVRALEERVRKAAPTEFPVLLGGETGTGKGVLARIIHHSGPRRGGPLVTVFCPSLERGLVESELFGHVRGAFTGADTDRAGKVEAAAGGTLFLDEIGELPLEIQPKILRLLQEKTYERRGDVAERQADVRIIAATNRELASEVEAGRFRRDLYERLNFVPIELPSLRERREDIPLLLRAALDRLEAGRWLELDPAVGAALVELDHLWPGNVREIEQLAARLTMECGDGPIDLDVLHAALGGPATSSPASEPERAIDFEAGLSSLVADSERQLLKSALDRYAELTKRELAKRLKISEATLYKKLKDHGLGD